MPQRLEIGPRIYRAAYTAATLTFTPLFDRAAIVTSILVTNPSAADNWTVTVGGREIMRFRLLTVGNSQLMGSSVALFARPNSIFDYARTVLGAPMNIPVANGISCVVASVGGATADIAIEAMEVDNGDISPAMMNDYRGNKFIMPITGYFNGTPVVGNNQLDTQVAPGWVPSVFNGQEFAVNFRVTLIALFLEAMSRNTFSGAANHVSREDYLVAVRNGQTLFGRDNIGIPLRPVDAAAGSANNVYQSRTNFYMPFQQDSGTLYAVLDPPIKIQGGDLVTMAENITGDVTGIAAADYATSLKIALALVEQLS